MSGSPVRTAGLLDHTPGPEYIAPFVCYLATEVAADISGSIFSVGGNGIGMYADFEISKSVNKFGPGPWTMEELISQLPMTLFHGYKAPARNYH
jgi:hypothetical protein